MRRTAAVCVLLSVVTGGVFFLLVLAIGTLRETAAHAQHAQQVLLASNRLNLLMVDIETGQRGFILTGDQQFLQPWRQGLAAFGEQAAALERLAAFSSSGQAARAHRITQAAADYISGYSIPLVGSAREDPGAAQAVTVTMDGKHRVDALRGQFAGFDRAERQLLAARQATAEGTAGRAIAGAATGVVATITLILLSGGYLARLVIAPVRRASAMASQVAGGDLTVRMPATAPGEVGVLEQALNTMAGSLGAMAVANSESRAQLAASRARVVAAADETRRRIERDLHDGTQQRLISLALDLRTAAARLPAGQEEIGRQWTRTAHGLTDVVDELREIARGLHPAILERGGLGPALRALARRSAVPADLSLHLGGGRLPERVEVAAYYVVSEALTNVAKHAHASAVRVEARLDGAVLRLLVRDDGAGGADPGRGSGLIGLSDRVEALGGRIEVSSPPGGGTSLLAVIPAGGE
ncbi:MAG: CHASE3 domain-containing protein [Gemmatimonadota bacterium]